MWLALSLLTALVTSTQDIIAKRATALSGGYVAAWAWMAFSVPFLLLMLWGRPPVPLQPGFWPALAVAAGFLTVSGTTFLKAIEAGELSRTLPILSFTPMFMVITSPVIVGEFPGPWGLAGIGFIIAGSWVLFWDPADGSFRGMCRRIWAAKSSRLMLVTAFLFSIGGNVDKVGVLKSSPLVWAVALNAAVAAGMGVVMFTRTPDVLRRLKAAWMWLLPLGFFAALMMLVQMTALTLAPASYVIAVKRTSILFSALAGFWLFRERGAFRRLPAVLLMLAGIFCISFLDARGGVLR